MNSGSFFRLLSTYNYLVKEVIESVPFGSIFAMNFSFVLKPIGSVSDCIDLVRLFDDILLMLKRWILFLVLLAIALRNFF